MNSGRGWRLAKEKASRKIDAAAASVLRRARRDPTTGAAWSATVDPELHGPTAGNSSAGEPSATAKKPPPSAGHTHPFAPAARKAGRQVSHPQINRKEPDMPTPIEMLEEEIPERQERLDDLATSPMTPQEATELAARTLIAFNEKLRGHPTRRPQPIHYEEDLTMNFTTSISTTASSRRKPARPSPGKPGSGGNRQRRRQLARADRTARAAAAAARPARREHKAAAAAAARGGETPPPAPDRAALQAEIDQIDASGRAIGPEARKLGRELERFRARNFPALAEVAEQLTQEARPPKPRPREAYEEYLAATHQAERAWGSLLGDFNRHRHSPGERINWIPP